MANRLVYETDKIRVWGSDEEKFIVANETGWLYGEFSTIEQAIKAATNG